MPTKNRYSPEFYAARPAVLDRAKNRCELCGAENYMSHPKTGKVIRLQVHHKDGNFENNRLENLIVLCPSCHSKNSKIANKIDNIGIRASYRGNTGDLEKHKNTAKDNGSGSNAYISKKIKKKQHRHSSELPGEDNTSIEKRLRVFIKKNSTILKSVRLYAKLVEIARYDARMPMPNMQIEETKQVSQLTETARMPMLEGENSDIIGLSSYQMFHRTKEEQEKIDAGYREMEGAIKWYKSLPQEQQQAIRAKIIEAHGSFAERYFVLEKYGRYLQTRLLQEKQAHESNEKAK